MPEGRGGSEESGKRERGILAKRGGEHQISAQKRVMNSLQTAGKKKKERGRAAWGPEKNQTANLKKIPSGRGGDRRTHGPRRKIETVDKGGRRSLYPKT